MSRRRSGTGRRAADSDREKTCLSRADCRRQIASYGPVAGADLHRWSRLLTWIVRNLSTPQRLASTSRPDVSSWCCVPALNPDIVWRAG